MNQQKEFRYTPKNDLAFKYIFGAEGQEEILKDLLEGLLGNSLDSLELGKETILLPEEINEKFGTLDVLALVNKCIKVNLEMQKKKKPGFENRPLFYLSKLYLKM